MLFARKNEKLGKGLCEISRCRAKSHTPKRVAFRSAEDQREPNQPDLVWDWHPEHEPSSREAAGKFLEDAGSETQRFNLLGACTRKVSAKATKTALSVLPTVKQREDASRLAWEGDLIAVGGRGEERMAGRDFAASVARCSFGRGNACLYEESFGAWHQSSRRVCLGLERCSEIENI